MWNQGTEWAFDKFKVLLHSTHVPLSLVWIMMVYLSPDILPLKNIMSNSTILGEDFFCLSQSALAYPEKSPSFIKKKKRKKETHSSK